MIFVLTDIRNLVVLLVVLASFMWNPRNLSQP